MTLCPFVSKFKDTISAVWPKSVCRHSPDSTSKTLPIAEQKERKKERCEGRADGGLNVAWRTYVCSVPLPEAVHKRGVHTIDL